MNKRSINEQLALEIFKVLPVEKREQLTKVLNINNHLTSSRMLEHGTMTVYKEGFYLELKGCRCGFKVYAEDNDGELIIKRKPTEKKLNKLYSTAVWFDEDDYKGF